MKIIKKKCKYCDYVVEGISDSQVESNLLIHKINKHKDKVKITEVKNGRMEN